VLEQQTDIAEQSERILTHDYEVMSNCHRAAPRSGAIFVVVWGVAKRERRRQSSLSIPAHRDLPGRGKPSPERQITTDEPEIGESVEPSGSPSRGGVYQRCGRPFTCTAISLNSISATQTAWRRALTTFSALCARSKAQRASG
jgi:hypothetical protein